MVKWGYSTTGLGHTVEFCFAFDMSFRPRPQLEIYAYVYLLVVKCALDYREKI